MHQRRDPTGTFDGWQDSKLYLGIDVLYLVLHLQALIIRGKKTLAKRCPASTNQVCIQ